jgi:hypothetical protein
VPGVEWLVPVEDVVHCCWVGVVVGQYLGDAAGPPQTLPAVKQASAWPCAGGLAT